MLRIRNGIVYYKIVDSFPTFHQDDKFTSEILTAYLVHVYLLIYYMNCNLSIHFRHSIAIIHKNFDKNKN